MAAPQVAARDTAAKPDATVVVSDTAGGSPKAKGSSHADGSSDANGGSAAAANGSADIAAKSDVTVVVTEANGGSAEAAGAAVLSELSLSDWVRLDTCVTVVDASVFLDNLHSIEELRDR